MHDILFIVIRSFVFMYFNSFRCLSSSHASLIFIIFSALNLLDEEVSCEAVAVSERENICRTFLCEALSGSGLL